MKELDLYQFLKENEIEMRWDDDVLTTWIPYWALADFAKIVGTSLDEGGREARLCRYGFIWIDMAPICEYYGIEPERIFPVPTSA